MARYCFSDELLPAIRPGRAPKPAPRQPLSAAEGLTTALAGARFLGGNLAAARRYRPGPWGPRPLHQSRFARRLPPLRQVPDELLAPFGQLLKDQHSERRYVPDSFPVPVCPHPRIGRCRLLTGTACHGRSTSRRGWF